MRGSRIPTSSSSFSTATTISETAYRFWTNPSGVQGDAIVTGNSAGQGDSSWDPVWDIGTEVTASGWSVEMRIPFSQLRFRPDGEQV